jgi:uncharacterized coiled-coil DUF342 family protein
MSIGTVLTLTGLFLTACGSIIAIAVVWGRFTEKVASLEKRMEEVRLENNSQHNAFYETQRQADRLTERMDQVLGILAEMKIDLKTALDRIPQARSEGK